MKIKSRAGRFFSILLVITMLMSVASLGITAVSAAGAELTYDFKYANAGYAEGRITLKAGSTADYGTYNLYWADDTKALDGYAPIKSLNLNTAVNYVELGEFIAIPADATKVIAVKGSTSKTVAAATAVFDIPADKQFKASSSEKEYDFQALSDIHIQHDDSYWVYSKTHWANALEIAAQRDVEFVAVCGDQVNGYGYSSLQKEWPIYLKILADSSFTNPVFETNGNHELKGNGGDTAQQQDHDIYKIGSGLNVETGTMPTTTYYEKTINGDHFLFMTLENSGAPNEYSEFSDAQLDWLEGLLNKYKNDGHKIILFQHSLIKGYGAGDDIETPFYGGGLNTDFADVQRFIDILEANKDVIWFSGHSHVDFKYNYNFTNMNGTSAYSVHIPATTSTTHPNLSTGSNDYIMSPDSSQGYFVDMYGDYVVINGTDLVKNEILPLYTYLVDYTGETLVENDMPDPPMVNYENVLVEVDVTALSENPSSVKVMLYGADDSTLSKEVTMAKTTDGTYAATVSTQFTKMKFIVNGSSSGEYNVANCKVVLGGIKVAVSLSDIKTKENGSCTSWAVVNAYAWNSSSSQNTGAWPGTAMSKQSDGTYAILLPEGVNPNMIIFNNGSSQTADLEITPYVVSRTEGSYTLTDGNGEIVTLPPVTTEPADPVETITVYFAKDSSWTDAYIYGFYGVEGGTATGEPLGTYPGIKMTYVETDDNGKDIYFCDVPADIDYIKFSDGSSTNRRTNNAPKSMIADGTCYCLGTSAGTNKWNVSTYAYEAPTDPTEPATSEPATTVPVTTVTEPVSSEPVSTDATEPSSTEDTEPVSSEVITTENTEPSSTAPVEYLYGDADLDGVVTIKDATLIQKYSAELAGAELEGTAFTQANVSGDAAVNIRDATYIQKFVANLIDVFPVEESSEIAEIGASATELTSLLATVKTALEEETYYASYVAYTNLKKAYFAYKDGASDVDTAYSEVNTALTAYNTMKKNNPNHVNAYVGSLGNPSTNVSSIDGLTSGTYAIRGSFNDWGNGNPSLEYMNKGSDGKYYISYQLNAGSYEFKFYDGSWYGNSGTMEGGASDWVFTTSEQSNCSLDLTEDGVYKFEYYTESGKVKISVTKA
ncbi:MAG: starch-binding protein [Ruminococcus sp.]|nr:starch-binding protein [Ruminococcus sp.]